MRLLILAILAAVISFHANALAAEIYGRAYMVGGSPARDATVTAICDGDTRNQGVDRYGRYAIPGVKLKQNCTMTVTYGGQSSNRITVYTGDQRTSANLELKFLKNRLLLIRRKRLFILHTAEKTAPGAGITQYHESKMPARKAFKYIRTLGAFADSVQLAVL